MGNQTLILGETELRAVMAALLDMEESGGLVLSEWERTLARLRIPQRHYTDREKIAIGRMFEKFTRSGDLARAYQIRTDANSPGNHARALRCVKSYAENTRQKAGYFWCPVCNTGSGLLYNIEEDTAILCENRKCVRYFQARIQIERKPRFANIIPQDVGTFLIESEAQAGIYYLADVVGQECTCDDFRYRHTRLDRDHKCKHLLEVNFAVYGMRVF